MRAFSTMVLGLVLTLVACNKGPSEDQCSKALDHLVSIEADAAGAKATTPEAKTELDKQKQKVSDNVRVNFMAECVKKMPKDKIECLLSAKDKLALEKCDTAD